MINRIATYLKKPFSPILKVQRRWSTKAVRWISDRLFFFSIRFRVGAFKYHTLFPRALRHTLARIMGDAGFIAEDLLKKSVWRATGSNREIVFVGSQKSSSDILPQFFDGEASYDQTGSTSVFTLPRKTKQWLQEGCDLVISESSRIYPFRPKASVSFTVPQWVNQMITFPEDMDKFLAGPRYKKLRGDIHKAGRAGFEWRFSRAREDFDFFYEHLYVPFARSRHGDLAHVAPYPLQWDLWIKKAGGGLVLITQAGKIVAGDVCLISDEICYDIEMGVLNADESLLQQGINAFLSWSVIQWGKQEGAKFYNMGGTLGWRSSGTFQWKAKWGSRVIRRDNPYRKLGVAADRLSPELIQKVNSIGFVCEAHKGIYGLVLDNEASQLAEGELAEMLARTQKEGLEGLCVVRPGAEPQFHENAGND